MGFRTGTRCRSGRMSDGKVCCICLPPAENRLAAVGCPYLTTPFPPGDRLRIVKEVGRTDCGSGVPTGRRDSCLGGDSLWLRCAGRAAGALRRSGGSRQRSGDLYVPRCGKRRSSRDVFGKGVPGDSLPAADGAGFRRRHAHGYRCDL